MKTRLPHEPLHAYRYVDIDSDLNAKEQYGDSVPVLMYGDDTICAGIFDIETLETEVLNALQKRN